MNKKTWDLTPLFKGDNDSQIELARKNAENLYNLMTSFDGFKPQYPNTPFVNEFCILISSFVIKTIPFNKKFCNFHTKRKSLPIKGLR